MGTRRSENLPLTLALLVSAAAADYGTVRDDSLAVLDQLSHSRSTDEPGAEKAPSIPWMLSEGKRMRPISVLTPSSCMVMSPPTAWPYS